ncbi:MAG TPA: type I DNA topoisomerase [bacterium]|jgi:DNA topoisomerase-1|nr:type I DNA topoisomerase [bacterium]
MADNLVVVESPAKAKTINKFLGRAYVVKASMGHVRDLPKSKLGVDVAAGFEPHYITIRTRAKVLKELKAEAKKAKHVFLATDPDREGEAIGWHLAGELKTAKNDVQRVRFHEITKTAVRGAIEAPTAIDENLVNAQQARRILDRLVGYSLSPLLWKSVRRGLSAGRVQSVAVRLVCEREDEIEAFKAEEYWDLKVDLKAAAGSFSAQLASLGGEKAERLSPQRAAALGKEVKGLKYSVASVSSKEQRRFAAAPFTTSTLQQEAARKLRFTAKRTMMVAQQLYEGVELGEEGAQGLITYMRTDSVRVAPEAQAEARSLITARFGADHLPAKPPFYKTKRQGQDAHEAVRPSSSLRQPSDVARHLSPDQNKLYGLIWRRFVASQMAPALFDATAVEVLAPRPAAKAAGPEGLPAGDALFRANGAVQRFAGFLAVWQDLAPKKGEAEEESEEGQPKDGGARGERELPPLNEGEALAFLGGEPEQHFTQPPARFSDASLVKTLEEQGIGRPSTYAPIISTILDRLYVERIEAGRLKPTELGRLVNKVLVKHFHDVLNVHFTALMEEQLDRVEEGLLPWREAVASFYGPFAVELESAQAAIVDVRKELETVTGVKCDKCGADMVVKWGRMGKFLACPNYPACKNTKPLEQAADGSLRAAPAVNVEELCEKCGRNMVVKQGRFGPFLACPGYPECKSTKAMPQAGGIACPKCGTGKVSARRSKKGRSFFGCDRYPACDFVSWDKPVDKPCPACGAKYMVEKVTRAGTSLRCAAEGCGHREEPQAVPS